MIRIKLFLKSLAILNSSKTFVCAMYGHVCIGSHVPCTRIWKPEEKIVPYPSRTAHLHIFLRWGLSLSLLLLSIREPQQSSDPPVSTLSQDWNYRCTWPHLAFYMGSGESNLAVSGPRDLHA